MSGRREDSLTPCRVVNRPFVLVPVLGDPWPGRVLQASARSWVQWCNGLLGTLLCLLWDCLYPFPGALEEIVAEEPGPIDGFAPLGHTNTCPGLFLRCRPTLVQRLGRTRPKPSGRSISGLDSVALRRALHKRCFGTMNEYACACRVVFICLVSSICGFVLCGVQRE